VDGGREEDRTVPDYCVRVRRVLVTPTRVR
jgi:hypothetical protein